MSSTIPAVEAGTEDGDERLVVHESKRHGPDRRITYEPRARGGYTKRVTAWRESIGGWHETGREIVENLAAETPAGFDE
ncbi:hypothetical protein OSG_eHP36_00115 [environmental Halophage eHP-36]|nr:hypothetical protein OSG_eHP36_00115 [environmental Halophage eHP-36]